MLGQSFVKVLDVLRQTRSGGIGRHRSIVPISSNHRGDAPELRGASGDPGATRVVRCNTALAQRQQLGQALGVAHDRLERERIVGTERCHATLSVNGGVRLRDVRAREVALWL
jgi:hypothetical protein